VIVPGGASVVKRVKVSDDEPTHFEPIVDRVKSLVELGCRSRNIPDPRYTSVGRPWTLFTAGVVFQWGPGSATGYVVGPRSCKPPRDRTLRQSFQGLLRQLKAFVKRPEKVGVL